MKMKRIVAWLMTFAITLTAGFVPTITNEVLPFLQTEIIASAKGIVGSTVTVKQGETTANVDFTLIDVNSDCIECTFKASYPLTITKISKAIESSKTDYGYVGIFVSRSFFKSGNVFTTLTVEVAEDAKPGAYPIDLSIESLYDYDTDSEVVSPDSISGYVIVEGDNEENDDSTKDSGMCGENVKWTLSGGGVLTISGTGNMSDDYLNDLFAKRTDIKSVIIENGVTSIGKGAFYGCSNLTSVTIPDSVSSIGIGAFEYCSLLENITIPNSVKNVGAYAFFHTALFDKQSGLIYADNWVVSCDDDITSAEIIKGTKGIGEQAFFYCENLETVTIPDSTENIGNGAFMNCKNLKSITIPDSVTNMGGGIFKHCTNLKSVELPKSIKSLGTHSQCIPPFPIAGPGGSLKASDGFFYDCESLESVAIPENVTIIDSATFARCSSLKRITIPNSVTIIKDSAFEECISLESVEMGEKVECIENYAFNECTNLKSIKLPDSLKTIGMEGFRKCSELSEVIIPDSVENLSGWAFSACSNLKTVKLSNSLKEIGQNAFWGCESLTDIEIPDNVENINEYAFSKCSNLKNVSFGKAVSKIGVGAFYGTNLSFVTIPDAVTEIGNYAFYVSSLKSVTIPDSVVSIGENVFGNCSNLKEIIVSEKNTNYSALDGVLFNKNKTNLLQYPAGNRKKKYNVPDTVTIISKQAFDDCESISLVTIPKSVSSIGNAAFYNCANLKKIIIENPDCEIIDRDDDGSTFCSGKDDDGKFYFNGTIYGYDGSTAQAYAEKWGYKFEDIASLPPVTIKTSFDINGDGSINVSDVVELQKLILGIIYDTDYIMDFNNDGKMNVFDMILLKRIILNG